MAYAYQVNAKYEFEKIEIQTNSVERAIRFMLDSAEKGAVVVVTNGFTGEVLATANDEKPLRYRRMVTDGSWATDENRLEARARSLK